MGAMPAEPWEDGARRPRARAGVWALVRMRRFAVFCALTALCASAPRAFAWGDEGHEVIARVAEHFLTPAAHGAVERILAGDDSGLVANDMADEATWADKYRDSDRDGARVRYKTTRDWHFADLEIRGVADLSRACHGRPQLPAGRPASEGPAEDCVVDKIEQFSAELADPHTAARERRLALQFLLHLVGDLHQPLHASDDHDQGGNRKLADGPGLPESNLHRLWDGAFVERLGPNATAIAQRLIAGISAADLVQWALGTPDDWARETYAVSRAHAYGLLPAPGGSQLYHLSAEYVSDATEITARQLSKAGVRLATLLNRDLHQR
jgi:S1/P1 Nuclease